MGDVDHHDDEPLFTVGADDDLPPGQPEVGASRRRWLGLAAVAVLAVAVVALGSALEGPEGSTPDPTDEPLTVDLPPEPTLPDTGWTWRPVADVPVGQLAFSVGSGLVLVDRAWETDATWAFSSDGEVWSEPAELPFDPLVDVVGQGSRSWVGGTEGVASRTGLPDARSSWELQRLAGVPNGVSVGWVADFEGVVVAGSRASWGRVDWSPLGSLVAIRAEGAEVVVFDPLDNTELSRLTAVHDAKAVEVRLVEPDGTVRLTVPGLGVAPENLDRPAEWMHHGLVPQTVWVGTAGTGELRPYTTPWLGEAAITADEDGFIAVAVDDDATVLEVWRSTDGIEWELVNGALVADVPVQSVRAAAGAGSLVVEYCGPVTCDRLVGRGALWWDLAGEQTAFPTFNGSEWWTSTRWGPQGGATLLVSDDATVWEEVPLPSLALESDEYVRPVVLPGRRVVLAVVPPGDQVEVIIGEPDPSRVTAGPRPPVGPAYEGSG